MKYFLYTRKSTEEEERQVLSLSSQVDKAHEIFPDLDIVELPPEAASAFKPNNRPVFNDMLRRLDDGEAHGVIAWHPDRLSRNELDAAAITYRVRTGAILELKFCSYTFDNSPEGMMMLQMTMSQSQYSSAKLSKDVKRGYEKKLSLGWKPGVAPSGYLNVGDYKGEKTIEPDPDRFLLVQRMWRLVLTGIYSVPEILNTANSEWGFTTRTTRNGKHGGTPLSRSALYAIFTNPFYYGSFLHNGQLIQGSHKPMITEAEYDRVQSILGRKGRPRPKTHLFAFRGLMTCGECGCTITAEKKTKYIKSTGETKEYTYYHCTRKRPCSQRQSVSEASLNEQVSDILSGITILPEFKDWALEVLKSNHSHEVESRSEIQAAQAKAILSKQREVDNLTNMRLREQVTDTEYIDKREQLTSELKLLKESQRDTEERADKWLELTERAFDFATNARQLFTTGTDAQRRDVFASMGGGIVMQDGKLKVELHPWFAPIKEKYPQIERVFNKVRTNKTMPFKEKTAALTAVQSKWLRGLGSNQRPRR